jgi:hypothetical protein
VEESQVVSVKIKVESYPTTDVYWRSHGLAIDQELNEDWWASQPHKQIAVTPPQPFTYETTVDLAPGSHTVEYAVSGYVPDYAWHAKIYVDDKLLAEGDVGRYKQNHLKATFTVGIAPPVEPWSLLTLVAGLTPALFVGGVAIYNESLKVKR